MINTVIQIVSLLIVILVIIFAGTYFTKNENAATNIKKNIFNFHVGLGTIGIGLLLILIIFFYFVMIQNVSIFMESNLNVPNAAGVLIGFTAFSIISNSLGAVQIKKYADDGVLTGWEILYTVIFFLLSISAELIMIYYGLVVHKWYYVHEIALATQYIQDIKNPIYGYTMPEIHSISRKVLTEINNLQLQSWKGAERMNILIIEAAFNFISIFTTTIGFAIFEVTTSAKTPIVGTGGPTSPIPPIVTKPTPFRKEP
ncbi:MAG TPA: hypothetical protein PKD00_01470 [Burkholderiales bacterium]|nr:hypothetical protein [Burkholderiales bacterium]